MQTIKELDVLAACGSEIGHILRLIFLKNSIGQRTIKMLPFPASGGTYRDSTNTRKVEGGARVTESGSKDILIAGKKSNRAEMTYPEDGSVHWKFPKHNGLYRSPNGQRPFPKLIPLFQIDRPFCFAQGHCDDLSIIRNELDLSNEQIILNTTGAFLIHLLLTAAGHKQKLPEGSVEYFLGEGLSFGVLTVPTTPGCFVQETPVGSFKEPASLLFCSEPLFTPI